MCNVTEQGRNCDNCFDPLPGPLCSVIKEVPLNHKRTNQEKCDNYDKDEISCDGCLN